MSMLPCRRGYALRVGLWLPRDRLRGDGFECPVGFAGLYPAGKPLDRVPLGPTAHRAVGPSLPDLLGSLGGFRFLRKATKGSAFGIRQPFEKGWTENLFLSTLRKGSHGPLESPPRSLSRGYRSPARGTRPRRHGCGDTSPPGNPLIGFPTAKRPTGTFCLPFLIFWVSLGNFAFCGKRPKALPLESASLLGKGWTQNLLVLAGR